MCVRFVRFNATKMTHSVRKTRNKIKHDRLNFYLCPHLHILYLRKDTQSVEKHFRKCKKSEWGKKSSVCSSGLSHAPVLTFTIFSLIKLLLSAVLNSIFFNSWPLLSSFSSLYLSIHPSLPPPPPSPSLPLSPELSPLLNLIDPEGG